MRRRRVAAPWLPVFGVGMLGVVIGHSLTYLLAVPSAVRSNLLAMTGHAYWSNAVSAGLLAGLAALGGVAIRSFRSGRRGIHRHPPGYADGVWRLAMVQVLVFGALEVCERAASGVPLASMFQDHILPIGVAIQVLVALVGAIGLVLLARVAKGLGARLSGRRQTRRGVTPVMPAYCHRPHLTLSYDPCGPRGPPQSFGLALN